jgi:hypothetical protein
MKIPAQKIYKIYKALSIQRIFQIIKYPARLEEVKAPILSGQIKTSLNPHRIRYFQQLILLFK